MANQIITDGDLRAGAAVLEASDGTKLALLWDGTNLELHSDIDATPNLEDSDTATTIFGGTDLGDCHAAIDSSDNIHIIALCTTDQTRDVSYCLATESAGSWTFGTWEEVGSFTDAAPGSFARHCHISIDSNDKPHAVYMNGITSKGTTSPQVMYTEKTGASWATPTQLSDQSDKLDTYNACTITLKASDDIEVVYRHNDDSAAASYLAYRTYTTSWSTQTDYTTIDMSAFTNSAVTVDSGGTVRRYWIEDVPYSIVENDTDTGYDSKQPTQPYNTIAATLNGTDRYIFYIEATSNDLHLISNTGSGWTDEGDINTGTNDYVAALWCYNNNNQTNLNYIYEQSGTVYWDEYSLSSDLSVSESESVGVAESVTADVSDPQVAESDSVGVAESVDLDIVIPPEPDRNVTESESVGVAESASADVSDPQITVSESVGVAESLAADLPDALEIAVNESVGVAESAIPDVIREITVSDSVGVAESATADIIRTVAVSESISVQDIPRYYAEHIIVSESVSLSIETPVGGLTINVSDSVGVAESVAADVSDPQVVTSDSVGVAESVSLPFPGPVSVSDSVGVAESAIADIVREVSTSDSVGVAESVAAELPDALTANVSDSVTVAESATADVSDPQIAVSDAVGVAESTGVAIGAQPDVNATASESVGVAESVAADVSDPQAAVSDSVGVAENAVADVSDPQIAVSDSVGVAESVALDVGALTPFEINVSEGVSVAESVAADVSDPAPVVSDSVGVAEAVTGDVSDPAITVSDSVGVAENYALDVGALPSLEINVNDSVGVAENAVVLMSDLQATVSDSVTVSENIDAVLPDALAVSVSDSVTVAESASVNMTRGITVNDSVGVAENVNITPLSISAVVTDSVTVTDTAGLVGGDLVFAVSDSVSVAESTGQRILVPFLADVALTDAAVYSLVLTDEAVYGVTLDDAALYALALTDQTNT